MNKDLAYRTIAYLKTHYTTNDETIINKEEIEAIDFILDELDQLTNNWNELEEWLKELQKLYEGNEFQNNAKFCITVDQALDKMKEIKEGNE